MQVNLNYNKQSELENCKFAKTVLMIIIVAYHSVRFWGNNWFIGQPVFEEQFLSILSKWLNSFHVYTFTLISGYIFYYLKFEVNKYNDFCTFIVNKSKRLLVPYLFIMIVWVVPFDLCYFNLSLSDIIEKYCFGVSPSQLWFLLMLFGVFVFFFILSKCIKEHTIFSGCMMLFLYGVGILGQSTLHNYFQIWNVCCFLIMFWLGFKLRQYGSSLLFKIPWVLWVIFDVVLFTVVQKLENYSSIYSKVVRVGASMLLYIIGAIMAFIILQKMARIFPRWKNNKSFLLLNKHSMSIYLFHQQLIYISISVFNGVLHPYVHSFVNFIIGLAGSLLISIILVKYRCTSNLLGEK